MVPRIVVSGFLGDAIGIGEAARGYAEALAAAGADVAIHPVDIPGRPPSPAPLPDLPIADPHGSADVVVHALHPPELATLRELGQVLPTGRRSVAVWAWEVDPVPDGWVDEADAYDEIWTYTEPVAERFRSAGMTAPVAAVPPPVRLTDSTPRPADDPPYVLTLADGWSSLTRKNPVGAVLAFRAAVAPGAGPVLVVKLRNGQADAARLEELQAAAAGRDDIRILDALLPRDELVELVARSACLVSLHRAEGLGLPVFEALALGVPVVCTDGSGPADLLRGTAARLVRARPVRVEPGTLSYPVGSTWLEPDLDDAAAQLRRVLDDLDAARAAARAARPGVVERLSPAVTGRAAAARVRALVPPEVSVILHGIEPWPAVRPIVEAVGAASIPAEVVVGAPDDDVVPEQLRTWSVRVAPSASTSPFELRQAAARAAAGELLVVTEDHCVPSPGWLDAYAAAHRTTGSPVLAGPVDNDEHASRADWASYLIGFAAWGSPLEQPPASWAPTVANFAVARSELDGALTAAPGTLERDVVPKLWAAAPALVADALVTHVQPFPLRRHALNHFNDCRTAGAHERGSGTRRSLVPAALLAEARRWLALASQSVGPRPALHGIHRRCAWHLRVLALARATGLAVGNRFGPGRAAHRLD